MKVVRLKVEASTTLEFDREEIQILANLSGYAGDLAKVIRKHITEKHSEKSVADLFKKFRGELNSASMIIKLADSAISSIEQKGGID